MKNPISVILSAVFAVVFLSTTQVYAESDVDILLRKFVERGIVSSSVASEIKEEIKSEKTAYESQGRDRFTGAALPRGLEDRVVVLEKKEANIFKQLDKIKFKGDFRLRYERKEREGSETIDRGRVRYRLGIESKLVDTVTVGAGLASGGDSSTSARSTNQDLQDVFSTKPLSLDYAFAEYEPASWLSVIGGKFKRKKYLWEPGDLLWDDDINPEGASLQVNYGLTDSTNLFTNTGVWILDESTADTSDPYLYYVQSGLKIKDKGLGADAKFAVTYYNFDNVQGASLDGALGDNSLTGGGGLLYKFTPIAIAAEVGIEEPFGLPIPRVAAFGEFVHNPDPDDENDGWLLGFKLGDKKVNNKNKWQFKYMFARLEKDAFLDVLPDADRYSGGTDVVSHEGIIQYGLNKNIMVEFDYYHNNRVNAASKPENLFQTSANFKF